MLDRIRKKWDVNGWRFVLILITFAVGGSLSGYLGKRFMSFLEVEQPVTYLIIYILIVTCIWPFMVLAVSIPFGQLVFFRKYLNNLWKKLFRKRSVGDKIHKTRIAIFASGTGSNAKKIIKYFNTSSSGGKANKSEVALIVCNNPEAGVLNIAKQMNVPFLIINKQKFFNEDGYLPELRRKDIHLIVLAGFLWKIPKTIIDAFPRSIINIHPALLPKYGGRGMYGSKVHKAVIEAGV
jgi:formyltetrahydrofolate hydrolase